MVNTTLTNEEHKRLEAWADEIYERRTGANGIPECPFCDDGTVMRFRHGNIHRDPIAWGQNRKCPECYFLVGFGVPMREHEYEETYERMGNRRNYNGKPVEDVEFGEVQERLDALGYLEM